MVVEDSSTLWPVSIQTASIKESITFLKKEVICNQLTPLIFGKRVEGVILSSKLARKTITSQDDLLLNRIPLLPGDCRTQGEVSQVAAYSDACRLDHGGVFWRKR